MSTQGITRRLERLERLAPLRYAAWLATLSDAELEELRTSLQAGMSPTERERERARFAAMSDAELEAVARGCHQ